MSFAEDRDLLACIDSIYDAAAGSASWLDVGARLCRMFAADRASLIIPADIGAPRQLLEPPNPGEAAYAAYFRTVDPFWHQAQRDFADNRTQHHLHAKLGPALVPDHDLLRSEFYNDYGRHFSRRHVLGGMLGAERPSPLSLARGESAFPFTEEDRRRIELLLPHIQRALELQDRLSAHVATTRTTMSLLDALPIGMIIVDGGLRVRFANASALQAVTQPGCGMAILASGPSTTGSTHLAALHHDDARQLRQLVVSAARGGSGGGMRVRPRETAKGEEPMQAVLVAPLPGAMVHDPDLSLRDARGMVLVVLQDLVARAGPSLALLCDIFGLTRSEAAVASGLVGGASAEDVAMARQVSLETVRTQVRAILRKSEAANLRDLERMLAQLASVAPGPARAPAGQAALAGR